MNLGDFIGSAVPWIIPIILVASWLVNHKVSLPKHDDTSATKQQKAPAASATPPSQASEKKLSDKDMTSG